MDPDTPSHICLDPRTRFRPVPITLEAAEIESDLLRIIHEHQFHLRLSAPKRLVAKEEVVHLPKLSLQSSSLSRPRRSQRVLVHRERKVAEDHAKLRGKIVFHSLQARCERAAGRTLE